jgi:hypothetical protein
VDAPRPVSKVKLILAVAEGLFWVVLAIMLWPYTLAYLGYRVVKRGVQRGLAAVLAAKVARSG